jgi:NAD(P)-dependent dehydrogenase (short-subunit alcohol dehydrogenase family)
LQNSRALPDLVVVTGAGRGIGKAIAEEVSKYSFVLCVSKSEKSIEAAASIRDLSRKAEALVLDLDDPPSVEAELSRWIAGQSFNRIGIVLAAAVLGPRGPFVGSELDDWSSTFHTNVFGNLAVLHALLPRQIENGFGRILFFAGGGAAYAYPNFPAYAASKAALVRIVENLHEDLAGKGDFAVSILAPGAVETDTLAVVRASGAEVRTTVAIQEPVAFATEFVLSQSCAFSGRFVHVRDVWKQYLNSDAALASKDLWKLRRVE